MNNRSVEILCRNCEVEFASIIRTLSSMDNFDPTVGYLGKYAIIRACGTIEVAFKKLIGDFCAETQMPQVKNFIQKRVVESSMNPSFENMCNLLRDFDGEWCERFKAEIHRRPDADRILGSLNSLNQNRNGLAHGQSISTTVSSVEQYFRDSKIVIEILDSILVN